MPQNIYTNNARSTLAVQAAAVATTLTLTTGEGGLFGSPAGGDWQVVTLANVTGSIREIVHVTGRAGDVLTVVRGQEGTTALLWPVGSIVEARITAGAMFRHPQNRSAMTGAIALGETSQVTDSYGTALGLGASSAFAGAAVGASATATGDSAVAVGRFAEAFSFSTALGYDALANALRKVAVGERSGGAGALPALTVNAAVVHNEVYHHQGWVLLVDSTSGSVGGTLPDLSAHAAGTLVHNGVIYYTYRVDSDDAVAVGTRSVAAGSGAIAIGAQAVSADSSSVAVGASAYAAGGGTAYGQGAYAHARQGGSTAVGKLASAGEWATALGQGAIAGRLGATALGFEARTFAERSVAVGRRANAFQTDGLSIRGIPHIQRDSWNFGGDAVEFCSMPAQLASPFIECGAAPAWQPAAVYQEGDAVRPTAPGPLIYVLTTDTRTNYVEGSNSWTSGPTEPTWPAAFDSVQVSPTDSSAHWVAFDFTAGTEIYLPANMMFFPAEVGFICLKYAGVSSAPVVSLGTVASPTAILNNQALNGITGAGQRQRFTSPPNTGITGDINFVVNTKAGGASSQFLGRFYVIGTMIQLQA